MKVATPPAGHWSASSPANVVTAFHEKSPRWPTAPPRSQVAVSISPSTARATFTRSAPSVASPAGVGALHRNGGRRSSSRCRRRRRGAWRTGCTRLAGRSHLVITARRGAHERHHHKAHSQPALIAREGDGGSLEAPTPQLGRPTPTLARSKAATSPQVPERHQVDTVGATSSVTARLPVALLDHEPGRVPSAQGLSRSVH